MRTPEVKKMSSSGNAGLPGPTISAKIITPYQIYKAIEKCSSIIGQQHIKLEVIRVDELLQELGLEKTK